MKLEFLFWLSLGLLAFTYAVYGIFIWLVNRIFKPGKIISDVAGELPEVAILIAAYNEEDVIASKICNTLQLDYPASKLHVYVVSDGSNDSTNAIVSSFSNVTLLFESARKGKTAAINRAMTFIKEPITVFTDANVMLNKMALAKMVTHYIDPDTGGVSGEKRVIEEGVDSASATEGLYWKYESFLKREDARMSTLVGAAGELFSIRTNLYEALPENTLLDDFMISMGIILRNYRIAYEPDAFATELPSLNINEEYKRKVRIGAGGIQSLLRLPQLLNPFRFGLLSFQYFFHRFMRWTFAPILIVLAYVLNMMLVTEGIGYAVLFELQTIFHIASLVGWYCERKNIKVKLFFVAYYFNFMHFCIVAGWFKYLKGGQKAAWDKSTRVVSLS